MMSRRSPSLFRQADIAKALRAAASAGVTIARIEIGRDGRIILATTSAGESSACPEQRNEWDEVLRRDKD